MNLQVRQTARAAAGAAVVGVAESSESLGSSERVVFPFEIWTRKNWAS
jgi:hypothetical protein